MTRIKAFQDWFGDSKVVHIDGTPLVVYHGTDQNFGVFSGAAKSQSTHSAAGAGIFFARDPDVATSFSGRSLNAHPFWELKPGANVMPVYLSINKPMMLSVQAFKRATAKEGGWLSKSGGEKLRAKAQSEGYDGIIVQGHQGVKDGYHDDQYIVFKAEQIKSAIGNHGDFYPANKDLPFSLAAEYEPIEAETPAP